MYRLERLSLSMFFLCALALTAATDASAQTLPAGSYQKTCSSLKIVNGTDLQANCLTKSQGASPTWLEKFTGAGKQFTGGNQTVLTNYFGCVGDISNNDGNLDCAREGVSPRLEAAKLAVTLGLREVFGREPEKGEQFSWVKMMFKSGMQDSFFKGWTSLDAINFLSKHAAKPENTKLRSEIIDRGYNKVYGFPASAERQAHWDAVFRNGSKYSSLITSLQNEQNSNEVTRKLVILKSYKAAMGRAPKPDEYAYWVPRKESYDQLVAAARNWLYSPNGSKDLVETVRRALTDKYAKKNVSDSDVKTALEQYAKTKKIFDEM